MGKVDYKECTQCKTKKPITDFWLDKSSKTGVKPYCKICGKKYNDTPRLSSDRKRYYKNRKERFNNDKEYHREMLDRRLLYRQKYPERIMLSQARIRSKKSRIPFNIDESDIIIPDMCPLLHIPLVLVTGKGTQPASPSLDRIDNSKGYIKGNVAVVSYLANTMKNSASTEMLKTFAANILIYIKK